MFGKELEKGTVTLLEGKFYWAQHTSVPPDTSTVHYFSTVIPSSSRYHPLATNAAAWSARYSRVQPVTGANTLPWFIL